MAQHDRTVIDDEDAQRTLGVHYGMLFGCPAVDLRRPGWTILAARSECDPVALLFGRRALLSLIAPAPDRPRALDPERAGVVAVTPELRSPVAALLRDLPPADLLTPHGLRILHTLVTSLVPEAEVATPTPDDSHTCIRYVSRAGFAPYRGEWQEWIEPLDEGSELEPDALALLARFSGGVYVVRDGQRIISYAGIRHQSPHVAEISARTEAEAHRGHGLARAVVSRATRAIFASERLPISRHLAADAAAARVADALGYAFYADAVEYTAPSY